MRILIVTFICLFTTISILGQQAPKLSRFSENKIQYNSAYAGFNQGYSFNLLHRSQWIESNGNLNTLFFDAQYGHEKIGGAINLVNDKSGNTQFTKVNLNGAYFIPFKNGKLSFGLNGGLNIISNGDAILIDDDDPVFSEDTKTEYRTILGAGLYFELKKFEVGIASTDFLHSKDEFNGSSDLNDQNSRYGSNISLISFYHFTLSEKLDLSPGILYQHYTLGLNDFNFNLMLDIEKTFKVGASYSSNDSISAIGGITLKERLDIGLAYDYFFANSSNNLGNTFELQLKYFVRHKKASTNL